jgi:hypothetical protein
MGGERCGALTRPALPPTPNARPLASSSLREINQLLFLCVPFLCFRLKRATGPLSAVPKPPTSLLPPPDFAAIAMSPCTPPRHRRRRQCRGRAGGALAARAPPHPIVPPAPAASAGRASGVRAGPAQPKNRRRSSKPQQNEPQAQPREADRRAQGQKCPRLRARRVLLWRSLLGGAGAECGGSAARSMYKTGHETLGSQGDDGAGRTASDLSAKRRGTQRGRGRRWQSSGARCRGGDAIILDSLRQERRRAHAHARLAESRGR